jgi:hypothetical protein
MSASLPAIVSAKFVTLPITDLYEFDFTAIGGSAKIYIASGQEGDGSGGLQKLDIAWDDEVGEKVFEHCDLQISNLRSDLTGQVAEPQLTVAAKTLWDISAWATATNNFGMMNYRGLAVNRKRLFYGTYYSMIPQRFFVKSVDDLSPEQITFTLTPSLGTENGEKPSARKLEI